MESYFVEPFRDFTEDDFGFRDSVPKIGILTTEEGDPEGYSREILDQDKSLDESDVLLNADWIHRQFTKGKIMPTLTGSRKEPFSWGTSALDRKLMRRKR